jgi:hypothetical protein
MRRTTAALTATTSLAALLVLAEPAQAKCGPRDMDELLAEGFTIAIVTRTDKGGSPADLRVEAFAGPQPPATLSVVTDTSGECQSSVAPGTVAAVSLHRQGDLWTLGAAGFELGRAYARADGAPEAVKGGPIVAYAAGNFGGARLAGLDAQGRTVAWGGGYGTGERVATCPGGARVVVLGRGPKAQSSRARQLTVHDATTLRMLRTVRVEYGGSGDLMALRCRDDDARRVDLLADVRLGPPGRELEQRGRLLTVDGNRVTHRDLEPVMAAAAVSDGFVAALGVGGVHGTKLVRISPRGTRSLESLPGGVYSILGPAGALTVAPDERTVALSVYGSQTSQDAIVTIDLRSGERLGSVAPRGRFVTGLAWVGPNRLIVRDTPYRGLALRLLDRQVRPLGSWPRAGIPNGQGNRLSTLGGDAVMYGRGRALTVIPRSGAPLTAASLRLAAAEHLVGVPGGKFATQRD